MIFSYLEVRSDPSSISTRLPFTTEMATESEVVDKLHQRGQCLCGCVKFEVDGKIIFNELCHCRACGRARGMTPVHLIGVKGDFKILQGQAKVKTVHGIGTMRHTICSDCGGGLYQRPEGKDFYATFPTSFRIESPVAEGVPSSFLPANLQPHYHANYENRLYNFHDELPKYKAFPDSPRMTNEGQVMEEKPSTQLNHV